MSGQKALYVIRNAKAAEVLMHPIRQQLLSLLAEPASAAAVAQTAGITRQIANYHLKELEAAGLVEAVQERKRGNVTERILRAKALAYTPSPEVAGPVQANPDLVADRFSIEYLESLAARMLSEVAQVEEQPSTVGGRVPSMSLEAAVKFRSAQDRAAFASDLSAAVKKLIDRYHFAGSTDPDTYRFLLIAHPVPRETPAK